MGDDSQGSPRACTRQVGEELVVDAFVNFAGWLALGAIAIVVGAALLNTRDES